MRGTVQAQLGHGKTTSQTKSRLTQVGAKAKVQLGQTRRHSGRGQSQSADANRVRAISEVTIGRLRPNQARPNNAGQVTVTAPALPAKADVRAISRAAGVGVDACVQVNTTGCPKAAGDSGPPSQPGPVAPTTRLLPVAAETLVKADVLGTPVNACVLVNREGCRGAGASAPTDPEPINPELPVIGADLTTKVLDIADAAACVRINGGSCGDSGTDPTDPGNPGNPGTPGGPGNPGTPGGPGSNGGNDAGDTVHNSSSGSLITTPATFRYELAGDRGPAIGDVLVAERLASTGAGSVVLLLLLGGLLALVGSSFALGLSPLRRRR